MGETSAAGGARAMDDAEAYRLIAEHGSDIVVHTTPDTVVDWVSPSITDALGYTPDEIVGACFGDLLHPDDVPAVRERLHAEDLVRAEGRIRTKDGAWRWMAARIERIRDEAGSVTGLVSSLRDIQAEVTAREALAARTAELEEARRVTGLGLWRRDLRTGSTTWSPEMFEIFGIDPAGPAPAPADVDACLTAEGREARGRAVAEAGPDDTWRVELEIHRPDGEIRWIRQSGAVERDAAGTIVEYHGTARDITERRRAELALAASVDLFRISLDAVPETVGVFTTVWEDGRFADIEAVYLNRTALDRWYAGVDFAEIEGQRIFAAHPVMRELLLDLYREVAESGVAYTGLRRFATPAGGDLWVDLQVAPFPGGLIHTSRDVTARVEAERAVEAARAGLEEAQRIGHVGSGSVDTVTGAVTWSAENLRLFGLDPAGPPPDATTLAVLYTPESWARVRAAIAACRAGDRPAEFEVDIVRPDGEERRALTRLEPHFDAAGTLLSIRATNIDITEVARAQRALQASEAQYRLLAESVTDIISRVGPDGTLEYMSGAVRDVLGYTPEEVISDGGRGLVVPEDLPVLAEAGRRISAGETATYRVRYRHRDGDVVWLESRAHPVLDAMGRSRSVFTTSRDVTAQVEAEDALRVSRAELAEAQRIAHVGSWWWDPTIDSVAWSDEMYRTFGLEPGGPALSAADQARYMDPATHRRALEATTAAFSAGEPWELEYDITRPDGVVRHVVSRGEPTVGADGAITAFHGTFADITEQWRAEQVVEAARAELAEAQRVARMGSWQYDAGSARVHWSEGMYVLHGLAPDPAGFPYADYARFMDPTEYAALDAVVQRLVTDGTPYEHAYAVTLDDGSRRHFVARGEASRDSEGRTTSARGSITDITEQVAAAEAIQAAHAELAEAQRVAHVGSWALDATTGTFTWSDELHAIYGRALGSPIEPFDIAAAEGGTTSLDDRDAVYARTLATGEPWTLEYPFVRPDGVTRRVVASGEAVRDASGAIVGLRGTVQDVTEQRAVEARLAESMRLEALGRLAGGVAHEFNNSLMAVLGTAELMTDAIPEDDPLRDDVATIAASARRAATLARQLQQFGRRMTLRPAPLDLPAFLHETAPLVRRSLGPDVELRIVTARSVRPVLVDRGQLEGVVLALALAAHDAMPGGGTLTLGAAEREVAPGGTPGDRDLTAGSYGVLTVTDTGEAIDPEDLPHVFEPFYATAKMGRGTGLGLAQVEGAVAQAGGSLQVASDPERGTTFTILLPMAPTQATPVTAHAGPDVAATGRTVLLVEDEASVRAGVARMIRSLGYAVVEADGPEEALALSETVLAAVDLLVTDAVMPEMDGGTLAHRLRESRPELPVLFISGYAPDDALLAHLAEPGTAFLAKPFERADLARVARELIGGDAATAADAVEPDGEPSP